MTPRRFQWRNAQIAISETAARCAPCYSENLASHFASLLFLNTRNQGSPIPFLGWRLNPARLAFSGLAIDWRRDDCGYPLCRCPSGRGLFNAYLTGAKIEHILSLLPVRARIFSTSRGLSLSKKSEKSGWWLNRVSIETARRFCPNDSRTIGVVKSVSLILKGSRQSLPSAFSTCFRC